MMKKRNRSLPAVLFLLVWLLPVLPFLFPGTCAAAEALPVSEADYIRQWTGEWILADDPDSTLVITPEEDGKLYILALFNRMGGLESTVVPHDEKVIIFNGDFNGSLVRGENDSVFLTVGSGPDMSADSAFYDFFLNRVFVFTKDGKPVGTDPNACRWASEFLLAGENDPLPRLSREGVTVDDSFEFDGDGRLQAWLHHEKTPSGSISISQDSGYRYVTEYDQKYQQIRRTCYRDGMILEMDETVYTTDGKKTLEHSIAYSSDRVTHIYQYYTYDDLGRLSSIRQTTEADGPSLIETVYAYEADGSWKETKCEHTNSGDYTSVTDYDSAGRVLRSFLTMAPDNSNYMETIYHYELDGEGRAVRIVSTTRKLETGEIVMTSYTSRTYDESGDLILETTTYDSDSSCTINAKMKNGSDQVICSYERTIDDQFESVQLYEYEPTGKGSQRQCTRSYQYFDYGLTGQTDLDLQKIQFSVFTGEQGGRQGISPLPYAKQASSYSFSMDDLENLFMNATREEAAQSSDLYPVGDCIYDSDFTLDLYGHSGPVRFIFNGNKSNRLQSIWWVCRDSSVSAEEIKADLEQNGVHWWTDADNEKNMLGTRSITGNSGDTKIILTEASFHDEKLIWLCFSYSWREREEGRVYPWETGPSSVPGSAALSDGPIVVRAADPTDSPEEEAADTEETQQNIDLPDHAESLSDGSLRFDYGLVAFEAPGEIVPAVLKEDKEAVSAVFRIPYRDEYAALLAQLFPGSSPEDLRETSLSVFSVHTTVLDDDQDAETTAWSKYDSPDHQREFVPIAGRTALRIRAADDAGLPYITTEYDIPLTGNRILSLLVPEYADGTLREAQTRFLDTLDIRDALYAEPPSADEGNAPPASADAPVSPEPGTGAAPGLARSDEDPMETAAPAAPSEAPVWTVLYRVFYADEAGKLLNQETVTLSGSGTMTFMIYANDFLVPAGYRLIGEESAAVTVENGKAEPSKVTFIYRSAALPTAETTPAPAAETAPAPSAGMEVLSAAPDGLVIAWNAVEGADHYRVEIRESGTAWRNVGTTQENVAFFQGLEQDTEYQIRITAMSGSTEAEPVQITARTQAAAQAPGPRVEAGQYVSFGHFVQGSDPGSSPEPIRWLVLEVDEATGFGLLLSRYALEPRPYHQAAQGVTWETSALRAWLNGEFLNSAFTLQEQAAIRDTEVDNSSAQGADRWKTSGGRDTRDKVFLLSCAEAGRYLEVSRKADDSARSPASGTAYAVDRGLYIDSNRTAEGDYACRWWLRSPGYAQNYAAVVYTDGSLIDCSVDNASIGVRPALWVDLGSVDP